MTLLYIMTTYDYHIRYVHCTCLQGSGHNSYQASCIESGEFWRVLGRPCVRHHWKCDIVDTFTHHICANRHGGTIGPSFPYIRRVWRRHSPQCNIIVLSLIYCWLYSLYTLPNAQHLFTRWALDLVCCTLCCTTTLSCSLYKPHVTECPFTSCWVCNNAENMHSQFYKAVAAHLFLCINALPCINRVHVMILGVVLESWSLWYYNGICHILQGCDAQHEHWVVLWVKDKSVEQDCGSMRAFSRQRMRVLKRNKNVRSYL